MLSSMVEGNFLDTVNKSETSIDRVSCKKCSNYFIRKNDTDMNQVCIMCRSNRTLTEKLEIDQPLRSNIALDLTTRPTTGDKSISNNFLFPKNRQRKLRRYVIPSFINILSEKPPKYQCSICKRIFSFNLQCKYHEACFTGVRPLECHICNKTYISKSHLIYHQRIHTGVKPFSCEICDKKFALKSKLNRHMVVHSAERPFKCEHCGEDFNLKQSYKIHLRKHSNDQLFPCKFCRRKFNDQPNLIRHEKKHADEQKICEDCGKKFKSNFYLKSHRRIHSPYKRFQCTFVNCEKAFTFCRDLNRHMQTHTEEEYDFECSICTKAFRRKDTLERHMKNLHPETVSLLGSKTQIVSVVKVKDLPINKFEHSMKIPETDKKVSQVSNGLVSEMTLIKDSKQKKAIDENGSIKIDKIFSLNENSNLMNFDANTDKNHETVNVNVNCSSEIKCVEVLTSNGAYDDSVLRDQRHSNESDFLINLKKSSGDMNANNETMNISENHVMVTKHINDVTSNGTSSEDESLLRNKLVKNLLVSNGTTLENNLVEWNRRIDKNEVDLSSHSSINTKVDQYTSETYCNDSSENLEGSCIYRDNINQHKKLSENSISILNQIKVPLIINETNFSINSVIKKSTIVSLVNDKSNPTDLLPYRTIEFPSIKPSASNSNNVGNSLGSKNYVTAVGKTGKTTESTIENAKPMWNVKSNEPDNKRMLNNKCSVINYAPKCETSTKQLS